MIKLNDKADVFIFPENKIIVLLNGKITEIKGNDVWFIEKLFRITRHNLLNMPEAIKLTDGREKASSVKKVISQLNKLGIILEAREGNFLTLDSCVPPYVPLFLNNGIWYFRRGEKFYFFQASDQEKAEQIIKEFALSWIGEEDEINLFLSTNNQKVECLAGQFILPKDEDTVKTKLSKTVKAVIFDSRRNKYSVVRNSFRSTKEVKFWNELSKRAVNVLGLVPIIKKIRTSSTPFGMKRHTYVSSHKLTDADGKINDFQIGTDKSLDIAKGKAIMESLERYCGRKMLDSNLLTIASFEDLNSDEVINFTELVQFSQFQFTNGWLNGLKFFDPKDIIPWIEVQESLTGKTKKVPLSFVSYAQKISDRDYPCHFFPNSSGMAAYTKLDEAIRRGALEIIERDAMMIHWFNKIKPKRIVLDNPDDYIVSLSDNLEKIGYKLCLVDLTLDTMPVIMAIAINDGGEFPFFAGAASSERKIDAIKKATEELEFTIWSRLKYHNELKQKVKEISLKTIYEPADHEALYMKPEMFEQLRFLMEGPIESVNDEELYEKMDLYSVLSENGLKLYYIDMTAKEVKQLALGIKVIRAIIPGFVPITFGYGQEPLGMRRLYKIPVKLGLRNIEITEEEIINKYLPHFFS
ncbi:MAG: YcaO-like family protein [Patescibacteria group bacterium]